MPPHPKLSRSKTIVGTASVAYLPVPDFLVPTQHQQPRALRSRYNTVALPHLSGHDGTLESFFFTALTQLSTCTAHRRTLANSRHRLGPRVHRHGDLSNNPTVRSYATTAQAEPTAENVAHRSKTAAGFSKSQSLQPQGAGRSVSSRKSLRNQSQPPHTSTVKWLNSGHTEVRANSAVRSWFPANYFSNAYERVFAESSRLPPDFFGDVHALQNASSLQSGEAPRSPGSNSQAKQQIYDNEAVLTSVEKVASDSHRGSRSNNVDLEEQFKLLQSIRELEERLANAKKDLQTSMSSMHSQATEEATTTGVRAGAREIVLTKEDYINLVDLYYYSHNSRFSPESTDLSPTPSFMDDYSFKLSADFSASPLPASERESLNEDESYESPLKHIERRLMDMKKREIAVMQVFIHLLLDEKSSNRALYDAYKALPEPGVAYLPTGTLRLFLQRMSTPWTRSEKSMLRYLSLMDDMQKAKLPISSAEWSSAVYLAGRSFAKVTDAEVSAAFGLWKEMENVAGVQSSHVTFNILFDIAVRAGKFALGQTILMEMSKRNLRLNRLGRVSLIYYHGLRGDGDGIRKTYRDFVEAGEIVDTVVLNCVIAALLNAQEPEAAHQIYERMKSMNQRARQEAEEDELQEEKEPSFIRYPPPGDNRIENELASQSLGRILTRAPHLRKILPDHHAALQASMPLSPDFVTYRAMISHHATTTGDLDRLSVLLHEMTDVYRLPLRSLVFQILFKGFTLHGPIGGPDSPWSRKRLDLCWNAFRQAVKDTYSRSNSTTSGTVPITDPVLPSITEINAIPPNAPIPEFKPYLHNPPQRRLSGWNEFVLDLAAFPQERLRRIERFHNQMFDDENMKKPHEKGTPHTFVAPFFQSTIYQAPEPNLDHEEGEYVLPNPTTTIAPQHHLRMQADRSLESLYGEANNYSELSEHNDPPELKYKSDLQPSDDRISSHGNEYQHEDEDEYEDEHKRAHEHPTQETDQSHSSNPTNDIDSPIITPTRPLICWLLRAYARNYKSRARVEEIWGAVRKMWKPKDALERESVIRVLRRCLRDCDREGR